MRAPIAAHTGTDTRAGSRAPRVPFALLVFGLLVGGLVLLLALNTASAANELHRHSLNARDDKVAASVQDLQVRVANSAAPGNLARAANELGMVPAGNPAFVVIGRDGKATVMGKPKSATEAPVPAPTTAKPKPSPTPSATPVSTPVSTPGATRAATPGATPTATPTGRTTGAPTRPATASTTPTAPTTTPTPTVTLPGGTR